MVSLSLNSTRIWKYKGGAEAESYLWIISWRYIGFSFLTEHFFLFCRCRFRLILVSWKENLPHAHKQGCKLSFIQSKFYWTHSSHEKNTSHSRLPVFSFTHLAHRHLFIKDSWKSVWMWCDCGWKASVDGATAFCGGVLSLFNTQISS